MMMDDIAKKDKGGKTKYHFIREEIQRKILSKEWPDGAQIPAEAEFCEMYGVSRITVRRALEDLQTDGYLEKIQGKGTFVRCKPLEQRLSKFYSFSDELRRRGLMEEAELLEMTRTLATKELARNLRVVMGAPVFRIIRIRKTEIGPYALEKSFIPAEYAPDMTAELIKRDGLYKTMANLGVHVDSATETLRAINVNSELSKLLNVRIDAAAIELTRTTYSGSVVVEYCDSVIRGDFFSYTVELK